MEFEYDPAKSAKHLAKHGIDFEQAQRMWDDVVLEFDADPRSDDARYLELGVIDGKHWTAISPTGENTRTSSASSQCGTHATTRRTPMSSTRTIEAVKASDIDEAFERGDDMRRYFDMTKPRVIRPAKTKTRKVNLTLPDWMVESLDAEADELAVSRNAVVNTWLAEKIAERRKEQRLLTV